mmetsp:Transcript_7778/g.14812  ORF Transcript_7778/g.14812 Transcript_7778/m.14812 type:complete len:166 (+) Transcript_7778:1011-1508(+)
MSVLEVSFAAASVGSISSATYSQRRLQQKQNGQYLPKQKPSRRPLLSSQPVGSSTSQNIHQQKQQQQQQQQQKLQKDGAGRSENITVGKSDSQASSTVAEGQQSQEVSRNTKNNPDNADLLLSEQLYSKHVASDQEDSSELRFELSGAGGEVSCFRSQSPLPFIS